MTRAPLELYHLTSSRNPLTLQTMSALDPSFATTSSVEGVAGGCTGATVAPELLGATSAAPPASSRAASSRWSISGDGMRAGSAASRRPDKPAEQETVTFKLEKGFLLKVKGLILKAVLSTIRIKSESSFVSYPKVQDVQIKNFSEFPQSFTFLSNSVKNKVIFP